MLVLPCLHTFCEKCLITYTPAESLTLTCPVCRQQSILPKDGVPGLQSNTWVRGVMEAMDGGATPAPCADCRNSDPAARCHQCHTLLCVACAQSHTQDSGSESHSVVSLTDGEGGLPDTNGYHDDQTTLYCPSHQGQTLRFYCRDCETAVCSSCTDIEHRAHNTLHLTDAVDEHRVAMHQLIDRVTMQLPCMKEAICDIQDVCRSLQERRAEAEKEVRNCFDTLHELLDKRQTALINSLNTIESGKQMTLGDQLEELESWVRGVESGCEFVEKALTRCPAMEVVLVRKQLGERLMDYANMNVPPAPRENSHLKFVVGNIDPLKTAFMHVGSIQSNSAVPHQTSATGEALRQVTSRSRTSRRPLSLRSSCSRRTNPIEDDMLLRVGRRGRNRGEFVNPQGIAFSNFKDGRIAVADSNNQCVQVFTLTGECKLRFGVRGRGIGQMQRPTGVAALPNGNYVVADYENKWVSIFEPSGKYISRIGHGKLIGPKGVCVDNNGHIIVVDNKASCVCIFQQSGKLLTKFGNRGTDEFQFAGPHFAAVNSRGHIAITDFHNHCVKVFDSDGDFLFTFGTSGEGNGQFNAPTGIAVDSNDNIIVADWGNSRIQVFDSQGSFLSYVNTLADPLYGPQGMTLTPDGQIFVADSGNHCFKVYKYLQ
nr:tripartite motif-containing protein 3-like isoform X5 [Cherax quadricarinatus]